MFLSPRAVLLALAFVLVSALMVLRAPPVAAAGPAGTLEPPMADAGLDTDGDGLFDYLTLDYMVNVTSAGSFVVVGTLGRIGAVVQPAAFLGVGLHPMESRFQGWTLFNAGADGPYSVLLVLIDADNASELDRATYTTLAYRATDFDPPIAILESVGAPWAVDTNANGLYDELRLNYTLNVTDTGAFALRAALRPSPTGAVFSRWTDTPAVGVGVHALVFSYPGGMINFSRAQAPFDDILSVVQPFPEIGPAVEYPVSTVTVTVPNYDWTHFDPPWVRYSGSWTDRGVDLDGDGLFEEIVVRVPLHLDRPASVTLNGEIGPSHFASEHEVQADLPAGDVGVDVPFPALYLREFGLDGPYEVVMFLTTPVLPDVLQQATYTTAAYASAELSGLSAAIGVPGWRMLDTDGDGAAERLELGVNLTARKTGDYFVDGLLWGAPWPGPMLERGRFLRLAAGTTVNVTMNYSGVALNRIASGAPTTLDLGAWRLDSLWGFDVAEAWTPSPVLNASDFASPPRAFLNGTVRSQATGQPVPNANIQVLDPAGAFWYSDMTDAFGNYSLDLYPGDFTLVADSLGTGESVAVDVHVDGVARADISLPPRAWSGYAWNATFSDWNGSSVTLRRTQGVSSAWLRIRADLFGNLDGAANATELLWALRYEFDAPYARPYPLPVAMGLGLSVDGAGLTPTVRRVTILGGAGAYAIGQPVVLEEVTDFGSPQPASAGGTHAVGVRVPYDVWPYDGNLRLSLPDGYTSTAWASANVSLVHPSGATWIIDPGEDPNGTYGVASATIVASVLPDTTPPTALFTSGIGERTVPMAFDGSGSTDDVGVTNYTWYVTANGTARTAYGPAVEFAFDQIGVFVVSLTVRDAAGNDGSTSRSVIVRDTTPPPAPSDLAAVVSSDASGAAAHLSWSAVAADDLAAYRVYTSPDGGISFVMQAQVPASDTSFGVGLPPSGVVLFRVTSLDRYGNEGSPSPTAEAAAPTAEAAAPAPPSSGVGIWALLAIAALALAFVAAVVVLRGRRGREPPRERGPAT